MQKWYDKATVQAALTGGIFVIAASVIGLAPLLFGRDTKVSETISVDSGNLASALKVRAQAFDEYMELISTELMRLTVNRQCPSDHSLERILTMRDQFQSLHFQHIDALNEGNAVAAHEILGRIRALEELTLSHVRMTETKCARSWSDEFGTMPRYTSQSTPRN